MKTKWFMLLLFLSSIIIAEGLDNKDEKITCVVSGDEIDKEESSNYREGMIYFCCGGCKMDFDELAKENNHIRLYHILIK